MTFVGPITTLRRAQPSHTPWTPHAYQLRASAFLQQQAAAALWMDPGLGKTSVVLDAFTNLLRAGVARRMLVIAPKRVCETVWRQEAQKWSDFNGLKFTYLHGPKKAERLNDASHVFLINPEGVPWLCSVYAGQPLPFDTVVIDELTKFKNSQSERHKSLRPRIHRRR